jgi:hypothetical protein
MFFAVICSSRKVVRNYFLIILLFFAQPVFLHTQPIKHTKEKTSFQTGPAFDPRYDVRSDVAIIYGLHSNADEGVADWKNTIGLGKDLADRLNSWKRNGYITQFMTGIAWGEYENYFNGKFDGKKHDEDGQVDKNGKILWHHVGVPYIVPSESYIRYFKSMIKTVIDHGITSIYLEEPEFWTKAGYSESFKKEWLKYYGSPWRPQHESPEATYLSSKLKYHLYYNALKEVFRYAKTYGTSKCLYVKCYVPTHSLLNYTAWGIVSPEASLASLPGMDGYIAQVWTGTARTPNYFNGVLKERVFENAFLEYSTMISMTAPTNKKIFLLTDPVEDRPRTWDDYKKNYQATFTAELMYPMVNNYEVMPWPSRIYLGKFKLENDNTPQPIPQQYATQIQVMINTLNDMPLSKNKVSGSHGIAVLLSNSLMFQRYPYHGKREDPELSDLYGILLPLLKRGVPVETVHMENLKYNPLKNIKVLVMSYSNMKPHSPEVHKYLAAWVKKGGVLVYVSRDDDPFQTVKEWWNTKDYKFKTPVEHLFKTLGINNRGEQNSFACGKGNFVIVNNNPNEFVVTPNNDSNFVKLVKDLYEKNANAGKLIFKNNFYLERGAYTLASVMNEMKDTSSLQIKGPVIDLFDPDLPVLPNKIIKPGEQTFLYCLERVADKNTPAVLCSASRIYLEKRSRNSYSFVAKSPSGTMNVMRILLPAGPKEAFVSNSKFRLSNVSNDWDSETNTLLLKFENSSDGINVKLNW